MCQEMNQKYLLQSVGGLSKTKEDLIVMKHSTSQNQSAGHNISQANGFTINYSCFILK